MSDSEPYGTHQHAAPGAVRAHTLVGEPIDHPTTNQVSASAATFSTAPYKGGPRLGGQTPPKRPRYASGGQPLCVGLDDTCGKWRMRGSQYCQYHDPKLAK